MKIVLKTLLNGLVLGHLLAPIAFGQDRQIPKLFGGWELARFSVFSADAKSQPFCEGAHGRLIYEKNGNMSVAINCGPDVAKEAPAREYGGMLFYTGTFSIHGNSVLHRIANSNVPELIGKGVLRQVESLTDTTLVLTGKVGLQAIQIEWRRLSTPEEFAPQNEIALLTYLKLKPGTEAGFMEAFRKIVKPSLSEPGNIAWYVQRSDDDPASIVFYTRWLNEDALHAHLTSPPLVEYISKTAAYLEPGYPQLVRFHPIDLLE